MNKIKLLFAALAVILALPTSAQSRQDNKLNLSDSHIQIGYKGMVDLGYGITAGDADDAGRVELATTHGYQFNQYLFAGVGLGINYFHDADVWNLPIYANLRGTYPITNTKVAPYLDIRIGYAAIDVTGFYFAPSIGARLDIGNNKGLSFGLGYEIQNYKVDLGYYGSEIFNFGAVTLRLGFDF